MRRMKSRSEWMSERRRFLRGDYSSKKEYKVGKSLNYQAMCSMCGKPLAQYSYATGNYTVIEKSIHMNYPSFYYVDMCSSSDKCYAYYTKKRG